jgi:hypothetical protein
VGVERVYSFADDRALVFLANLDLARPALIVVELPLRQGGAPIVYPKGSPEWAPLAAILELKCIQGRAEPESCTRLRIYDRQTAAPEAGAR